MLVFNVNDNVKVKLAKKGFEAHERHHMESNKKWNVRFTYRRPAVDSDGFCTFQMWEFMHTFGSCFHMGMDPLIESNNLYFESAAMRTDTSEGK